MNFKGNRFLIGAGEYAGSYTSGGKGYIFIKKDGVISLREFDYDLKRLRMLESVFSFADYCYFSEQYILELSGEEISIRG